MFSLISLALALSSSSIDTVKVEVPSIRTFHREGKIALPAAPAMVAMVNKGENSPERYTTCYEVRNGSCWSETSTEYFKGF